MKLYHGTTGEAIEEIIKTGVLYAPVYFSPRQEIAAEYALNNDCEKAVVISVEIDRSVLNIDHECYDDFDLDTALEDGVSVYVTNDVNIENADFDKIGYDYEN